MTLSKKEGKAVIVFLIATSIAIMISNIEYFDKVFYITGRISFIIAFVLIVRTLILEKLEG